MAGGPLQGGISRLLSNAPLEFVRLPTLDECGIFSVQCVTQVVNISAAAEEVG
jgi:hypothetical protein